jgi:hypothetical protein
MTAATARVTARPARQSGRTAARSAGYLRLVVTRRSNAAKAPFIAVVVGILAAGLLGLLVLNTTLAQDAFRLHALQVQGRVLADQEQGLQREVERLQSPQALAAKATALGMVPGGPPAFLRLADGKVLGAPLPGQVAPPPPAAPVAAAPAVAKKPAAQPKPAAPAAGTWVAVPPAGTTHRRTTTTKTATKSSTKTSTTSSAKPTSGGHR